MSIEIDEEVVVGRGSGGHDGGSGGGRELHGKDADAARRAADEDGVLGAERERGQRGRGGGARDGQRRGIVEDQPLGDGEEGGGRDDRVVGHRVTAGSAEHCVADREPGDVGAEASTMPEKSLP